MGNFSPDEWQEYTQGPSNWEKAKTGAIIGGSVGLSIGAVFGTFSAVRAGLRGRELINVVGNTMVQSGVTFGFFMGIGSVVRSH